MYILNNLSNREWDNFLENSNQNNIFCSSKYLNLLNENYINVVMADKNNTPIIGIIIFKDDLYLNKVPAIFNGVILNKKFDKPSNVVKITESFINLLTNKFKGFRLKIHYNFTDIRGFQWFNYFDTSKKKFEISIFYTGILNLGNKEILNKNINKGRIHSINKAIKNNYKSIISDDVKILNQLHDYTFRKQNINRTENEIYFSNEIAKKSIKEGFGKLRITINKNKIPVSASLFLLDKNQAYYLVGGSNEEGLNNGGASLNIYDQIKGFANDGKSTIDFVGINSPNRGYFKSSFGCESKIYFDIKI